ncbi:uncharacterized protein [Periplaneta americana]|uniref:uncharacterized protein isoform X3 n=1 Tax=Periplaneta americana TaxID=6978 RepID=UPI0037E8A571
MDLIKMESKVDPLAIKRNDDAYLEEKPPSSEEVNVLNMLSIEIKTECEDNPYDVISEVKSEESQDLITLPKVKCETERKLGIDSTRKKKARGCRDEIFQISGRLHSIGPEKKHRHKTELGIFNLNDRLARQKKNWK